MANSSVSAWSMSRNDISSLAQIFEAVFHYYCNHCSPFEEDDLRRIKTVAGLGFTAALVDGDLICCYESHLNTFRRFCSFKEHQGSLSILSLAIAEMVNLAVYLFRVLHYPHFYEDFVAALKPIFSNVLMDLIGKREDADKLCNIFLKKKSSLFG